MNSSVAEFSDQGSLDGGQGPPAGVGRRRPRGDVLVGGQPTIPVPVVEPPALRRLGRGMQVRLLQ